MGMSNTAAKTLFLDIETFPNKSYTWGKYDQNVIRFLGESCIASYAAKWLHDDRVFARSLPDYKGYRAGSYDDRALTLDLWKLFNEADVLVAHNGNQFDIKVVQGRFLVHDLKPPSPIKRIDTKLMVKAVARFNSNKLDDLGNQLFSERKIKTDFDLWEGCINGDKAAWRKMVAYNKKDVLLLEKLYLRLRPWATGHPNVANFDDATACPKCGSHLLQSRGMAHTTTRVYRRFQCVSCGGWGRATASEKRDVQPLTNVV